MNSNNTENENDTDESISEIQSVAVPNIPEQLIFEHILKKLGVKTLIRFKCVSKSWLSEISCPYFTKLHFSAFAFPSLQFLLFSGNKVQHPIFTVVTFNEHGGVEETAKLGFTRNEGQRIHVVWCCNGLLCYCDQYFNFYIVNPMSRQYSADIPSPEYYSNNLIIITAGFGYVSSIDDYKIVCLVGMLDNMFFKKYFDVLSVYVFSLRTQRWEMWPCVDRISVVKADVPVLINDTLYWYGVRPSVVLGVNLVTRELSKIPFSLLGLVDYDHSFQRVKLFGTKGRFSLCYRRQVWVLNQDGLSWRKSHELNSTGMQLFCASETTGKWLVINRGLLALLDPSKGFRRQCQGGTCFDGQIFNAWDFKMTLISPIHE